MRLQFLPLLLLAVMTMTPRSVEALPYLEDFTGTNGAAWPSPWVQGSAYVTDWDIQNNRARLNGQTVQVARMLLPGFSEVDVDMLMTLEFEDVDSQGIGIYCRQNGGSLQEYVPYGQGYAVFLKGGWGWPDDLGIWREINGVETQFATAYNPIVGGLQNNVRYRVRFRVTQIDPATTQLQARVWVEGNPEPALWNVDVVDTEPLLQGTAGSFAADIYNQFGTSNIYLDDFVINSYPSGTDETIPVTIPKLLMPAPNPVHSTTRLQLSLPTDTQGTVSVHDVRGRVVAFPFGTAAVSGSRSLLWQPKDQQGRALPLGAYFLRLVTDQGPETRQFVILN